MMAENNDATTGPLNSEANRLIERIPIPRSIVSLLVVSFIIFATMSYLTPSNFLSVMNLQSMGGQIPVLGLLSVAMMLSMLSGGIDLAVVSTANLAGILSAITLKYFMSANEPILGFFISIAVAIIIGAACGLFNGFLIGEINITPILATLGTMLLYMGIGVGITEGSAIFGFTDWFLYLGGGNVLGIPVGFLIFLAIVLIVWVLLTWTPYGFKLYMMGTNPIASRFSGINNKNEVYKTYLASGIISALAGVLLISNSNSAKAGYGTSFLLQSILVVVLGGVNPYGGFGSIWGVALAVITLLVANYYLIYRHQSS